MTFVSSLVMQLDPFVSTRCNFARDTIVEANHPHTHTHTHTAKDNLLLLLLLLTNYKEAVD